VSDSVRGRLLVAAPSLLDPNFHRTVVLMLEHNDEGALGVVLNRPSDVELEGPLPTWHHLAASPPVVFVGGPVGDGMAIGLGSRPNGHSDGRRADDTAPLVTDDDAGYHPVFGALGSVDLGRDPDDVGGVQRVRVFAGYAGWSAGQLESELELGGWIVVDADVDDAFSPQPDALWRSVLRRQSGRLSWLANFPDDPRSN